MSAVYDLQARRAVRPRDAYTIIENLNDGAATLHAEVASWPYRVMREGTIVGLERQMDAMRALLAELRAHVEGGPTNAA